MRGKGILLIVGVLMIVSNYMKFIIINKWWITLCFILWFVLLYFSIHNKNKDRETPRPVYLTN